MDRRTLPWIAAWAGVILAAPAQGDPQVKGIKAFHRAGQTFVTFRETGTPPPERLTWGQARRRLAESKDAYRLYAHTQRITARNIGRAVLVAEVRPLSGWNLKGRNVEHLIAQAMIQPDAVGELARNYNGYIRTWHMNHPRMDRYPLKRLVIDEGGGPLEAGTGLFVVNPPAPGRRHYAVIACPDGEPDKADISAANSLAAPVVETVGPGEPVRQGPGLKGPHFDFPGERTIYVQWCGPPLAPRPMYFSWSVLIPPDCPERAAVELFFPAGNYSHAKPGRKLLARSVQIATQDWPHSGWYGYNDRYGTGRPLAGGTVGDHTQRRIVAFLAWARRKLPIDPERIIATGSDGAALLAVNHPELVSYVIVLGFDRQNNVLAARARKRFEAAWGPKGPQTKDRQGRGEWAWADLDRLVLSRPRRDLPLFVCRGASWGGVKGWGKGRGRFYTAMKQARQPLFAHWAWGGRLFGPHRHTGLWQGLDLRRDTPVPAFANSSIDAEGEGKGQTNSVYRWKDIADTPEAFEVTITGAASSFDMTPRRLRRFKARPGEKLRWEGTYLPGRRRGKADPVSGTATVDENGLVTLKQLKLTREVGGIRLRITRSPDGREVRP